MPRDGNGQYVRPAAGAVVDGTDITTTWANASLDDAGAEITKSIANDGQTPIAANLPMDTFRHTGVGNAAARTDYAAAGQAQDSSFLWGGTAGGTADALTIALTPPITAYAAGQKFRCISSASPNTTTTPTININSVGAKTFKRRDGTACVAGDISASTLIEFVYDGTNMLLQDMVSPVTKGGTGRATSTTAYGLIAAGTTATGAQQTLATGATTDILVSGGAAALPVWTTATGSGAPVRATSPTLVTPTISTTIGIGGATPAGTGSGISFPATQSASTDVNTLDDYEEGTWTPSITFGGGSTGITYGSRAGRYTKIGNCVTVSGSVALSAKGSSTGLMLIGGFPFITDASMTFILATEIQNLTFTGLVVCHLNGNSSFLTISATGGAGAFATDTNFTNSTSIVFSGISFI